MSILSALASYSRRPVWLVEITQGSNVYRYSMGSKSYVYEGQTFSASPLYFDEINYSSEIRKDDFTIKGLPLSDADTQAIIKTGLIPTSVRLIRGFEGSGEYVVSFSGRMSNLKFTARSVSLVCTSWAAVLASRLPGNPAQRQCPFRLYSTDCGVTRASFETAATADTYNSGIVNVAAASSEADGYYVGGIITFNGEGRSIEKHVSGGLTLSSPFLALEAEIASSGSASVSIAAGCDKSLTTCRDRFSNIENNGSFPGMSQNPFYTSVF